MKKEFVTYELAVKLKALGFDEPCFGRYIYDGRGKEWFLVQTQQTKNASVIFEGDISVDGISVASPLYQQAFRWFRNNYSTHVEIHETTDWEEDNESWSFVIFKYRLGDNDGMISSTIDYKTYEEAELACLIKLIEIVEQK